MNTNNNNSGTAYAVLFVILFFLFAGYASAIFLFKTIIPAIGLFKLIMIPIAWELLKCGIKAIGTLLEMIFTGAKCIEKDNTK